MQIQDKAFVAIEYTMSLDSEEVVDRSTPGEPYGFIFGTGQILPGLEKGLKGMEQGQSARITVGGRRGFRPAQR